MSTLRGPGEHADDMQRIVDALGNVMAELQPVLAGLDALGPASPPPVSASAATSATALVSEPLDPSGLVPMLRRLDRLIADSNVDAAEVVNHLQSELSATRYGETLGTIATAIAAYDFDTAQTALTALTNVLQEGPARAH